jgi:hypothetical protein
LIAWLRFSEAEARAPVAWIDQEAISARVVELDEAEEVARRRGF